MLEYFPFLRFPAVCFDLRGAGMAADIHTLIINGTSLFFIGVEGHIGMTTSIAMQWGKTREMRRKEKMIDRGFSFSGRLPDGSIILKESFGETKSEKAEALTIIVEGARLQPGEQRLVLGEHYVGRRRERRGKSRRTRKLPQWCSPQRLRPSSPVLNDVRLEA